MTTITASQPALSLPTVRPFWSRLLYWMPLTVVLAAQVALSARLLWHAAPFPSGDEGRDIYAGHQLIHEFWHGGGSPYYETYFSGAPVIFPVLAAMVDHVSGLTGVRLMSLQFMLTANVMLFATTRRLFGYWAAVTASGLFAGLALTQNLGIYATYDVMSLMLMTVAAYCAIRSRETPWLLVLPLLVVLANATKYATIVFDPVIIAMAALQGGSYAWRYVVRRLVALSATIGTALLITAALAGTAYVRGVMWTTFARNPRLQSLQGGGQLQQPEAIVDESLHWIGAVFVVSLLAFLFALVRKNWDQIAYLVVLIVAGSLVTLESVRLHSAESMWKHDDFAVWFSCAAAGAVVNYVAEACRHRWGIANTAVAVICAALIPFTLGLYSTPQARNGDSYATRPLEIAAAAFLKPYLEHGRFLMGARQDDPTLYYDHLAIPWWAHFDDLYIKYPIPGRDGNTHDEGNGLVCYSLKPGCAYLEGPVGYRMAIRAHWFSLVTLIGRAGQTVRDEVILQTVEHTRGYRLISRIGGEPTWIYVPDYRNYPRLLPGHLLRAS